MLERLSVRTNSRVEMIDITGRIQQAVSGSGVRGGLCTVYVPHTTAAVTINENADPHVGEDVLAHLTKIVPYEVGYRHREGNSDAHIKASLVGFSENIFVEGGELALGTWQAVFFCEFDGPRSRELLVKVVGG